MRRLCFLSLTVLLVVGAVVPAAAQETTTVTVIHAVPADDGFPADVYLNEDLIIDGFVFEAASDLFTIPAGRAHLRIFADGSDPDTADPAVTDDVTFTAGRDYTIVAQILGSAPVLTVFINETSQIPAGQGRLTVRQTSGIADLDITLDGEPLFAALAQANEATAEVAAGSHTLAFLSGGDQVADRTFTLAEGQLTVIYAVGVPEEDSFSVLLQQVVAQQTEPGGVPTGTGGMKAGGNWLPWLALLATSGLIVLWKRDDQARR
jgi:hypothetical protein